MACLSASMLVPRNLKPSLKYEDQSSLYHLFGSSKTSPYSKKYHSLSPVMRLFGPAIFEASKLKVLILGVDQEKTPKLPRTYTLTHSDITSKLTLAISQTINISQLQGWYNKLQRDEVVAEWRKVKGKMSLHVHCHISGGHFLLDLCAKLRYYIFRKELPVVLKAFVHGDENLFNNYPELQDAMVWVYFHSNLEEYNRVEWWGPLRDAAAPTSRRMKDNIGFPIDGDTQEQPNIEEASLVSGTRKLGIPEPCKEACTCCFPPTGVIPWSRPLSQEEVPSQASLSIVGTHEGVNR